MLETLKKKARTSNITRIIVSIIAVVIMLAVTQFAIFDVITGPTKIDITADPALYEGKYVTIDAEHFLYDYIEHTTTTTRQSGSKTTSTNGYSYMAFQAVADYDQEGYIWYFYSIYLNKKHQDEMNSKMEQTYEYLNDESGKTAPPDPVTVKGVWKKMDSQTEYYFQRALTELGVQESDFDKIYFYEIDTKNIGGMNAPLFWCLMAVSAGLIVFAVLSFIGLFSNAYMKQIQQYQQTNSSISLAEIDEDFKQAHLVAKHVWIGKRWTVYMSGNKAKILTNKDLIWGYYFCRTGRNSVSEIRLYNKDKGMSNIGLSEKHAHEALNVYAIEQPQMVVGYSADLEKMYNKDFKSFMELKYNPAMLELETMGRTPL